MVAHGVSRGFAVKNSKPRTGDTILVTQRFVFRPSGACSLLRFSHGSRRGLPSIAPLVLTMPSEVLYDPTHH